MASNSSKSPMLPVSEPARGDEGEKERLLKGDEKLFRGSAMTRRGANAAISYMACAVLLVMFNKAALSSYNFPCANVITLLQMISSCSFLYFLRRWKIINFTMGDSLMTSDSSSTFVPLKTLMHTLPLAVAYLLYMVVSVESVRGVNVPMYTTLRRTTVAFTMIMEYFLAGQKYTPPVVGSQHHHSNISCNHSSHCLVALIALALCGAMVLYVDRFCCFGHFFEVTWRQPSTFHTCFPLASWLCCVFPVYWPSS
ncbi:hypothetical protein CISIN_1g018814mg [Citrus sinensis]|uniref:Sugar phosphate transporter domain-containing protein n=1 Tax=Citrus sinensis TaxID=2711 RepID=A0A067F355_CITSI|nr:hypothetical protein CISIN_1g018814mg [Citrus sinensis]